jgi:hypothetical protein
LLEGEDLVDDRLEFACKRSSSDQYLLYGTSRGKAIQKAEARTLLDETRHLPQILVRRVHPDDGVLARDTAEPSRTESARNEVRNGGEDALRRVGAVDVDEETGFLRAVRGEGEFGRSS